MRSEEAETRRGLVGHVGGGGYVIISSVLSLGGVQFRPEGSRGRESDGARVGAPGRVKGARVFFCSCLVPAFFGLVFFHFGSFLVLRILFPFSLQFLLHSLRQVRELHSRREEHRKDDRERVMGAAHSGVTFSSFDSFLGNSWWVTRGHYDRRF